MAMTMNPTPYIETSVVSYLSARASRDIVVAAHQQLTRRWWKGRSASRLCASQIVRDEAALGSQRASVIQGVTPDGPAALTRECAHRRALRAQHLSRSRALGSEREYEPNEMWEQLRDSG